MDGSVCREIRQLRVWGVKVREVNSWEDVEKEAVVGGEMVNVYLGRLDQR